MMEDTLPENRYRVSERERLSRRVGGVFAIMFGVVLGLLVWGPLLAYAQSLVPANQYKHLIDFMIVWLIGYCGGVFCPITFVCIGVYMIFLWK